MRHRAWLAGKTVKAPQYQRPFSEIQLFPERLTQPLHWKKPSMIFVNSMSDLFHSKVPDEYIAQVFATMQQAHWHTFQILTKRPGRLRHIWRSLPWPGNIWIGVSIEINTYVRRADVLREVPAAVRFLSCEPLLGPLPDLDLTGIHWCICGGESGAGYRPLNLDWARELRDRCATASTVFYFKQVGGPTAKSGGDLLDGQQYHAWPSPLAQEATVHANR